MYSRKAATGFARDLTPFRPRILRALTTLCENTVFFIAIFLSDFLLGCLHFLIQFRPNFRFGQSFLEQEEI